MKKLTFAVVALASCAVFAESGIVSANCVGYQGFSTKDTLGTGYTDTLTPVGIAFESVGADKDYTIETSIFDRTAQVNDKVVIYNPLAMDYETYTFLGYNGEESEGWSFQHYNDNWEMVIDSGVESFTTSTGNGVLVTPCDYLPITVTVAGQVKDMATTQTWSMAKGEWTKAIMNPYPIDTTFADLETFAKVNDTLYVVNPATRDCDTYVYLGKGNGWFSVQWGSDWTQHKVTLTDSSAVIIPAGGVGYYNPIDTNGRTWGIQLSK